MTRHIRPVGGAPDAEPLEHDGEADGLYTEPRDVRSVEDCWFYHTMDLPLSGPQRGSWDLRAGIDAYLGHVDFDRKRVLEIGPASGYVPESSSAGETRRGRRAAVRQHAERRADARRRRGPDPGAEPRWAWSG